MTRGQKFIVWDWNGTLQDDFCISIAAVNHALSALGKAPVDAERYRECFDVPIERTYRNLGLSEEEISRCFADIKDAYFELYDEMVTATDFRPGARDILDFASARGIAHVVLSNHVASAVTKDLRRLGKLDAFHEILAWPCREVQFSHPKGDFLVSYMNRHGLRPEDGLVVGDTVEEIRLARDHGLVCVAISGGYTSLSLLEEAKPDYIIHNLPELEPVLRERRFAA